MTLVTTTDLLEAPEKWHLKPVQVLGSFRYEIENISIGDDDSATQRLWVDLPSRKAEFVGLSLGALSPPGMSQPHTVVIEGYFESGSAGHFGMFSGAIVEVSRVVLADQFE